jgi:UDP-N-acetylmuramate--alanine ligase
MITQIFRDTHKDPTVIIGSLLIGDRSNFIAGKSEYFIVEACEYRRSFLNINPTILVITNIDADHLDYYKDIEDIKSAFRELALKVPAHGFVVCNPNDDHIADVIKDIPATVVDMSKFFDPNLALKIPGIHNRKNASAAKAVADIVGISNEEAVRALGAFPGTWRRFEYKGKLSSGALVYDDYAHHPREVTATLLGFRELYPKEDGWKITVVFQPHLFSRTKLLLDEFAVSFDSADTVLLLPIYYAREEDDGTISSEILANKISGAHARTFGNFEDAEAYIKGLSFGPKDIIVTMGAGEAYKVGDFLLKQ